jgi:farnesyl diphosphate synthase
VSKPDTAHLSASLNRASTALEAVLEEVLPPTDTLWGRVGEAMRYATFAGGKRLRPFLVLQTARLFGVPDHHALRVGAAIEVLHTYSLVHDDLPCMDDDDLRRGRPTTHKAFDEATAVLAGDALLTIAFEILSDPKTHPSAETRLALVARLAQAGGYDGMIGGQMIDMRASQSSFGIEEVILLQRMKTGALFEFSCEAGAILGGGTGDDRARMRSYARDIGLAFQIADDILDATGTVEQVGKAVGKDQEQGKATFISLYGIERARQEAHKLAKQASDILAVYGPAATELRALPFYLVDRNS